LSEPAARAFRLVGLHPGPQISLPAVMSFAGSGAAETRRALGELTGAHLLSGLPGARYTMHDLLRAYASEQAHVQDAEGERRAALRRGFDHYLGAAHAAAVQLNPHLDPMATVPAVAGESPEGDDAALAWLEAEYQVLLSVIRSAAAIG